MRVAESRAVLTAIARGNRKTMPRNNIALPPAASSGPRATLLDTFTVPELRRRMVILMLCWFIVSLAYYGVNLALEDLPGSLYLNFFLIAAVELPSYFATIAVRTFFLSVCLSVPVPFPSSKTVAFVHDFQTRNLFITCHVDCHCFKFVLSCHIKLPRS